MFNKKDCFDFCSETFGEMQHSTEEEKELYENMLERMSVDTGINIFNTNGEFKSTYEVMQDIAKVWDELD